MFVSVGLNGGFVMAGAAVGLCWCNLGSERVFCIPILGVGTFLLLATTPFGPYLVPIFLFPLIFPVSVFNPELMSTHFCGFYENIC